jgi:ABC-type transport system involved in cytochrome bd biosynthesis fused ATPase/permease subunit
MRSTSLPLLELAMVAKLAAMAVTVIELAMFAIAVAVVVPVAAAITMMAVPTIFSRAMAMVRNLVCSVSSCRGSCSPS